MRLRNGVGMEINGQGVRNVKVTVLFGTGDTPARALMLNLVKHNRLASCLKCEQRGECRGDSSGARVFPYRPEVMKPRTKEPLKRQGFLAMNVKKGSYMGCEGPNYLHGVTPDPVRGTSIDEMHHGGQFKSDLKFFLENSFNYLIYKASKLSRSVIDDKFMKMKPHFLTRVPNSINDIGMWQTSLHKSMSLYYALPVLKGTVPDVNFEYFATLVAAAQYLNSDCVTPDCLTKADALIHKYVLYFEDLYRRKNMPLNVHLLLHLVELVEEHGPLTLFSCYPMV